MVTEGTRNYYPNLPSPLEYIYIFWGGVPHDEFVGSDCIGIQEIWNEDEQQKNQSTKTLEETLL